jgi:hypothetical protein
MARFRKVRYPEGFRIERPIDFDVVQFTGANFYECARFLGHGDLTGNDIIHPTDRPVIPGPDGGTVVEPGEWIVRGPNGRPYRVDPVYFDATFAPVG